MRELQCTIRCSCYGVCMSVSVTANAPLRIACGMFHGVCSTRYRLRYALMCVMMCMHAPMCANVHGSTRVLLCVRSCMRADAWYTICVTVYVNACALICVCRGVLLCVLRGMLMKMRSVVCYRSCIPT